MVVIQMKIEKLKSGNFRIQPSIDGKRYSITFDHKPTQKEINQAIYERKKEAPKSTDKSTFEQLAYKYIENKNNVLSPSTIRSYKHIINGLPLDFLYLPFFKIEKSDVQAIINAKSAELSAKTVRNYNAFIMAVLKFYDDDINWNISLPSRTKPDDYMPTPDDIKQILEASKGTKWYKYFILGCYGFRRSEILPLTMDDIHDDYIEINKTMVMDENKQWVIKPLGKTESSLRNVPVPEEIIALIRKEGIEIDFYPDKIWEHLKIYQKKLGIHQFTFHKLRHYFCTELSDAGFSEEDIISISGHSTPYVMKSVYRHQKIRDNKSRQKRQQIQF